MFRGDRDVHSAFALQSLGSGSDAPEGPGQYLHAQRGGGGELRANSVFNQKNLSPDSHRCSASLFEDPLAGIVKAATASSNEFASTRASIRPVARTFWERRVIDPISTGETDNHGTERYVVSIADHAGKRFHAMGSNISRSHGAFPRSAANYALRGPESHGVDSALSDLLSTWLPTRPDGGNHE